MYRRLSWFIFPAVFFLCGSPSAPQISLAQLARSRPAYTTEQEWVVHQIVRGIIEVSRTAGRAGIPVNFDLTVRTAESPADALLNDAAYELTTSAAGVPPRLTVVNHVWSADTYLPVARAFFREDADAATEDGEESLVNVLTDPTVDALLDANDRVSARLQRSPRSAAAHKDAALLVGALALKEVAPKFSDVRPALCRMSVHLAIAEVLAPARRSAARTIATAITLALVNRQRDALTIVTDLERASSPAVKAWGRALRLRVTGDWRKPGKIGSATRLEQMEYLRAVFQRRGYGAFLDAFDLLSPGDDDPDMLRVGLLAIHDVEAGNRWAESGLQIQLDEAQRVWSRFHEGDPAEARLVHDLNDDAPASGVNATPDGPRPTAIDWGLWAGFLERHLCARLEGASRHLSYSLGLREEGDAFTKAADASFAGLLLYPVVSEMRAQNQAEYARAIAAARELVRLHPERVTAPVWWTLRQKPGYASQAEPFPTDAAWLRPHVPTGAVIELGWRSLAPGCERPVTAEQMRLWAESAPYDSFAVWATLWGRPTEPTMAEARGRMEPFLT